MSDLKHVEIDGAILPYLEEGSGVPVVLVHGTLGDYRTWRKQMKPLGAFFRVISFSRRFHYPATWSEGDEEYTMERQGSDLARFLQQVGAAPAHLMCASWGGNAALQATFHHPELVRSLVLCEPPSLPLLDERDDTRPALTAFHQEALGPVREALAAGRMEEGVQRFVDAVMGQGSFARFPHGARKYLLQNATELNAELTSSQYFAPLTSHLVSRITCPVLLVAGERSPAMFHRILDILHAATPHARRLLIPNASHGMYADNPAAFNKGVLEFLLAQHSSEQ